MAEPSVKGAGLRSLDEVFEDEDLTLSFRAFLHSIGSAHYLSLFVEIELLQMMDDADDFQLHSKTHKLYERYLRPGAQQEVHIDESARARLQGALLRPSKRMFVDISAATRIALEQTLLPRYQKSEQFRRLVHEKNLQAHGQLRRPKPADQKTTKEATFTKLFRLIVGKELRDSGDKSVPANRTRTDRADTVALINDMRSQKQAHGAMPSSPTIHSLNHSQGSPERAPSPPSPTLAPSVVKRPGSPPLTSAPTLPSQTASPSPPTAPAPVAASNSGPIVRLERPAPSLLESQYLLMPPLDAEPLPSHPRQERTPTVTAMETPMPPTQSPYASALAQAGLLHSSDSNDLRLHRQLTTPMLMPRADVLGQSLAKEVAVMQAAQAAQAAQTHSAEPAASALPPPVLSQHTFQAARPSHLPHSASSSSLHDARPSPGGGAYALPAPLIVKAHSSTAAPGRDASAPIPTPVSSSSSSSSASGSPTRDRLAVGSPAREPAVVRSSPTLQSRSANLPPPVAPLSLSAGALPARSISKGTHAQLRQGHAFQGATGADQIAPPTPPVALTSPTTKSRLERAKWCAFFEYCGIPPEDAPVAAEQVMAAGIDSSMIGTLSQGLLQGAGLKLGYVLRIIKKQREESAPPPQQTTPP